MAKTAPDVRQTAKTMNEFARENEKMAVMDEMMEDAMAGAFSDDDEAEDDVIGQVLAEIGVDINAQVKILIVLYKSLSCRNLLKCSVL